MKKMIIIFLFITSIFTYYIFYKEYENVEWQKSINSSNFSDFSFVLANEAVLSDPEIIYPIIERTAKELSVNVFRNVVLYTEGNSIESIYYVLLTTDTKLFNTFDLKEGRYLNPTETQSGELFLSSNTTKDQHQIGTFKVFGNKNAMIFRPLIDSYHHIPVTGEYHIESIKPIKKTVFYETLAKNFNERFNPEVPFTSDYFITEEPIENDIYLPTDTKTLSFIKLILAGVIALLVFYYILYQGKAIATFKMHGINNTRIWMNFIGNSLLITFFVTLIASIGFSIFQEGWHSVFIFKFIIQHIQSFGIIAILSIIALFYIMTIKINEILKNRKDTKVVLIFNLLLKSILFVISIFMITSLLGQISLIDEKKMQLTNWEKSAEYGVFYPFYIGLDDEDLNKNNGSKTFIAISELYTLLNQEDSLLINTKYYEETTLGLPFEGIRFISVNPNYLEKFPVISQDNKAIFVEEAIQHQLLLVPSQYKEKEQEILAFFNKNHLGGVVYDEENLLLEVPEHLTKPNYQIIWTQNHQEIFSFNPEVFPTEDNMIIDPIIMVVTENNSLTSERHVVLGGGATDPLKVKLVNGDSSLTYNGLKSSLQELQLDDNLKYLVTINHLIFKQLNDLKQERLITMLVLISIISSTIFILVQNTILMFHNQKKLFIVRSLFGTGFFKTYRSILYTFFGTWLVQVSISMMINSKSISLAFIVLTLLLVEFVMIIMTIIILENRNKINVLKGGA